MAADAPLVLELVPSTSWGDNLRSRLAPKDWDVVRQATYKAAGFRCEICHSHGGEQGSKHRVEAHEVWAYDDFNHVQTLTRMIALCPLCHSAKHIGFTMSAHPGGPSYLARVLDHIGEVNGWTVEQTEHEIGVAMTQWRLRSQHQWRIDITYLRGLLR